MKAEINESEYMIDSLNETSPYCAASQQTAFTDSS